MTRQLFTTMLCLAALLFALRADGEISENSLDSCQSAIDGVKLFEREAFKGLVAVDCRTQVVAGAIYRVGLAQDRTSAPICHATIVFELSGDYQLTEDSNDSGDCLSYFRDHAATLY